MRVELFIEAIPLLPKTATRERQQMARGQTAETKDALTLPVRSSPGYHTSRRPNERTEHAEQQLASGGAHIRRNNKGPPFGGPELGSRSSATLWPSSPYLRVVLFAVVLDVNEVVDRRK